MNKEEIEMLKNFINLGISESASEDIRKYGYLGEKVFNYINQLEEEIKKLKNMYNHHYKYASDMEGKYVMAKGVTDWLKIWLEEMLDKPNDIFSVVKVKDVLDKIKELEGGFNE